MNKQRQRIVVSIGVMCFGVMALGTVAWQWQQPQSAQPAALPTRAVLQAAESRGTVAEADAESIAPTGTSITQPEVTSDRPAPTDVAEAVAEADRTPADDNAQRPTIPQSDEPVANQIIVEFDEAATDAEIAAYVEALGGTIETQINALNAAVITLPDDSSADRPAPEAHSPIVVNQELNYKVRAADDAPLNDPYYTAQWGLIATGVAGAWATLPTNTPIIRVALIDSGVCADHPDLAGRIVAGWDFVEADAEPQDAYDHGCGVAGIIAANTDNGVSIAGIAPHVEILPLRVLDASGAGTYAHVAEAILYAVDHGAQLINLSLGGTNPANILDNAVQYAVERGVTVIAAAGNTGNNTMLYPALIDDVIAVGAVDATLRVAPFSSSHAAIDLYAPGASIYTTTLIGEAALNGTSYAAPYVTGIAALEAAMGRSLTLDGQIVTVGGTLALSEPVPVDPVDAIPPEYATLYERVQAQGALPVIVSLDVNVQPEGQMSASRVQAQREAIAAAQQSVLTGLSADVYVLKHRYKYTPALAMTITPDAFVQLLALPQVAQIVEDSITFPALNSSLPVIGADDAHADGHTGEGWAVAILDSGVQSTHPMFSDGQGGSRVVAGACFNGAGGFAWPPTPTCPNNGYVQYGVAAGEDCNELDYEGCEHGTHVAGIAAGDGLVRGVAPDADILAINVFTKFSDFICFQTYGRYDCIGSYDSDQIAGLEYVYDMHVEDNGINVAAANMSLGGFSENTTTCDSANASMTAIINQLASVGVATVIASGNEGYTNGASAPGCISSAITVGATTDSDTVASFSNSASYLDLLAPGASIYSSTVPNTYSTYSGTSMATPHVAGAWAVLKQLRPSLTVAEALQTLQDTGRLVTDFRAGPGYTKPRIQLDAAIDALTIHPANDDIAAAVVIAQKPQLMTVQTTENATLETDEPTPSCVTSANESVWYRYTTTQANETLRFVASSDFDAVLSVWRGSADVTTLLPVICAEDDDEGADNDWETVAFTGGSANTTYYIMIASAEGASTGTTQLYVDGGSGVSGAVIAVNSASDSDICDATTCTLRGAVNAAVGGETISFNIPGFTPHTIDLGSPIAVDEGITIDGSTQPGFALGQYMIEVTDAPTHNFILSATDSATVQHLVINGALGDGITVTAGSGHTIRNNWIGVGIDGSSDLGNGVGVDDRGTNTRILNNVIMHNLANGIESSGTDTRIEENVISSNDGHGVIVTGDNITFIRNKIGVDATGQQDAGNGGNGVIIVEAALTTSLNEDVISGNGAHGVYSTGDNTIISWAYIGTNSTGTGAIPNQLSGVAFGAGSDQYVFESVVAGNAEHGIRIATDIAAELALGVGLFENTIGLNSARTAAIPNGGAGVYVGSLNDSGAHTIQIGGTFTNINGSFYSPNVIAGNMARGIWVDGPINAADTVRIFGNTIGQSGIVSPDNGIHIEDNAGTIQIGTDAAGTDLIVQHHAGDGIMVTGNSTGVTIGEAVRDEVTIQNNTGDGVHITQVASGVTVQNSTISGNAGHGVRIEGDNNILAGNRIGLNESVTAAQPNGGDGVYLASTANNNDIGTDNNARNIIAGNTGAGINIDGAPDTEVRYAAIGNSDSPSYSAFPNNVGIIVGAETRIEDSHIGGNTTYGLHVLPDAASVEIIDNIIGTDSNGMATANGSHGVYLEGDWGDQVALHRNIISGNMGDGVRVAGLAASFFDNLIGVDASATSAVGNGGNGITIESTATGTTISADIIGGNAGHGVYTAADVTNVLVSYIGTDSNRAANLPNGLNGIQMVAGSLILSESSVMNNNQNGVAITGSYTSPSIISDSVIVGNGDAGVHIYNAQFQFPGDADYHMQIASNQTMFTPLAIPQTISMPANAHDWPNLIAHNGTHGIQIENSSNIGIFSNTIEFNGAGGVTGDGIYIDNSSNIRVHKTESNFDIRESEVGIAVVGNSTGVDISGVSITNTGLGIDLGKDGPTPNDTNDTDNGANGLQNHPILVSAEFDGGETRVTSKLNSTPDTSYRIDYYSNPACGFNAQTHLGSEIVTLGAGETTLEYTHTLPAMPDSTVIHATATNLTTLQTSELSLCPLAAPTGLAAAAASRARIDVSWIPTDQTDQTFLEHRRQGDAAWTMVVIDLPQATYALMNLYCSTTYEFRVQGYAADVFGSEAYSYYSDVVSETTDICPSQDTLETAAVVDTLPYNATLDTQGTSPGPNDPVPSCGSDTLRSVWYSFTPDADGDYNIHTIGSDFDTVLSIWEGTDPLNEVDCDDASGPGQSSYMRVALTNGVTYSIMVAGDGASSGTLAITVERQPDPTPTPSTPEPTPPTPTPTPLMSAVGIFDAASATWLLRDTVQANAGQTRLRFGNGDPRGLPVGGDFDGDGDTDLAIFNAGIWTIYRMDETNPAPYSFQYGAANAQPVAGDWDGDGVDGIGVFDGQMWSLRNTADAGVAHIQLRFGLSNGADALPLAGDWFDDARDRVGLYADGIFYLKRDNTNNATAHSFRYGSGDVLPVVGDWDGDGDDTIGIYIPEAGIWRLRNANSSGIADIGFSFGLGGLPVANINAAALAGPVGGVAASSGAVPATATPDAQPIIETTAEPAPEATAETTQPAIETTAEPAPEATAETTQPTIETTAEPAPEVTEAASPPPSEVTAEPTQSE